MNAQGSETLFEEEIKTPEKLLQFIVFTLGGEEYGVGILDVKEMVRTGQITIVPNMPDFVKGVINLRGRVIVVIDLAKRFLLQREGEYIGEHIIVVFAKGNVIGLLVDEVTEVLELPEKDIKPTPKLITKIDSEYLVGVATLENRVIMLLDVARVLSEEELIKLSEAMGKHYREIEPEREKRGNKPEERPVEGERGGLEKKEEKVEGIKKPEKVEKKSEKQETKKPEKETKEKLEVEEVLEKPKAGKENAPKLEAVKKIKKSKKRRTGR